MSSSHARYRIFGIFLLLFSSQDIQSKGNTASVWNADTRTAAEKFTAAAHQVEANRYGNVSLVMSEERKTTVSNHTKTVMAEIRYWAFDNKYFRFDRTVLQSNDPKQPKGSRERMIVTPDAYIVMAASSSAEPLSLDGWGTPERGRAFFGGKWFVCSSVRIDALYSVIRLMHNLMTSAEVKIAQNGGVWTTTSAALSENGSRLAIRYTFSSRPIPPTANWYAMLSKVLC